MWYIQYIFMYIYTLYNMIYHVYICIYICMYIYIVCIYIACVYIYILHGFTWYVYIIYVYMWCIHRSANAPRHAETHRQVHPQSAQNASAALASKFPLPWRRYTSNSPGGWSSRSRGFFLSQKKTKKHHQKVCKPVEIPTNKTMAFVCFVFFWGEGIRVGS